MPGIDPKPHTCQADTMIHTKPAARFRTATYFLVPLLSAELELEYDTESSSIPDPSLRRSLKQHKETNSPFKQTLNNTNYFTLNILTFVDNVLPKISKSYLSVCLPLSIKNNH